MGVTQKEAKAVLVRCFSRGTKREKANMRWHLERRTPVLCGEQGHLYTDGKGGG